MGREDDNRLIVRNEIGVICLDFSKRTILFTLKMKSLCFSETSVASNQSSGCNITEDLSIHDKVYTRFVSIYFTSV